MYLQDQKSLSGYQQVGNASGEISDEGGTGGISEATGIGLRPACFAFFFFCTVRGKGDRKCFWAIIEVLSECSDLIVTCAIRSSSRQRYVEYQDG